MLERHLHLWRRRSPLSDLLVLLVPSPATALRSIPAPRAAGHLRAPRPWARSLRMMPGRRGTRR